MWGKGPDGKLDTSISTGPVLFEDPIRTPVPSGVMEGDTCPIDAASNPLRTSAWWPFVRSTRMIRVVLGSGWRSNTSLVPSADTLG